MPGSGTLAQAAARRRRLRQCIDNASKRAAGRRSGATLRGRSRLNKPLDRAGPQNL
jgi:hypothetical protein